MWNGGCSGEQNTSVGAHQGAEIHGGSAQQLRDIRRNAADAALRALCAVVAIDEELEGE
jgi:hypothetical protein